MKLIKKMNRIELNEMNECVNTEQTSQCDDRAYTQRKRKRKRALVN